MKKACQKKRFYDLPMQIPKLSKLATETAALQPAVRKAPGFSGKGTLSGCGRHASAMRACDPAGFNAILSGN